MRSVSRGSGGSREGRDHVRGGCARKLRELRRQGLGCHPGEGQVVRDKGAAPFKELSGEGGLNVGCVRNLGFHFPSPTNIRFVCHAISLMWSSFPRWQSL